MSDDKMQRLLMRARSLRYKGVVEQPTAEGISTNRSCGDRIRFVVVIHDGTIAEVAFESSGCVLSQVAADIAAEIVDQGPSTLLRELSDETIIRQMDVTLGPNRRECVTVAVEALRRALTGG